MDWERYRACCDRGDVLSRWLLQHSAELLEDAGAGVLAARLRSIPERVPPVPRPADHRGGQEADFFEVSLDLATACEIRDQVAAQARDPERRLANGRGLGGMVEAWAELVGWLDGSHPRSPLRTEREQP